MENMPKIFVLPFFLILSQVTIQAHRLGYSKCYLDGNFTRYSIYHNNLIQALSTLPTTNSGRGYFNQSTGFGNDTVHSTALCRGDIDTDLCMSCVQHAIIRVRVACPNQKGAVIYFDECWLSYYNSYLHTTLSLFLVEKETVPHPIIFKSSVHVLLKELSSVAANGDRLQKFSSGNTTWLYETPIYGLVQCRPDFSYEECNDCLENEITEFYVKHDKSAGEKTGGSIMQPTCMFKFSTSPFFNITTLVRYQPPPPPPKSVNRTISLILSPSAPTTTKAGKSSARKVIIEVVIGIVGFIMIIVASICIFLRMRKKEQTPQANTFIVLDVPKSLQYTFNSVKIATNDFSDDNILGKGGFGNVYKGTLENGQEIAVKRLKTTSNQGGDEFKNEAELLAKVNHCNLVQLCGYSIEGTERLLMYELMPHGSLDKYIFDPSKSSLLDWEKRRNIIIDVACGLHYLHEGSRQKIVHRDLKAANVLLDANWKAKIGDFGLAKMFEPNESHRTTNHIVGTR
ncbi:putative protein kinase RLK-Pelle-DLSV family [Helianthus anomalus]